MAASAHYINLPVPTIHVSNVTSKSAIIKLNSDFRPNRYIIWLQEIGLIGNINGQEAAVWSMRRCSSFGVYKLLGLRANTKYAVYGEYEMNNSALDSEPSQILEFIAMDELERMQMIVSCWERSFRSAQNTSNDFLIDLVQIYYRKR